MFLLWSLLLLRTTSKNMFLIRTAPLKYIEKKFLFFKWSFFMFSLQNFFFFPLEVFVYSFYIKIQRFSSIGHCSVKIVRDSRSGAIISTLSQSNLNSKSSDFHKTWEKLCSTQIMNFGTKKNSFQFIKKNLFLQIIAIIFYCF